MQRRRGGACRLELVAAVLAGSVAWLAPVTALGAEGQWGEREILASRVEHHADGTLADAPQFSADPMNLIVVVEAGGSAITVLDGDQLEPMHRLAARATVQGEPQFSPDGRFAWFVSADGRLSRFDLWNLKVTTEARVGIETNDIAVAADGRHVAVANAQPHTLVILDAALRPLKVHTVRDREGRATSRVASVCTAAARRSFVAALSDVRELWELSYDPTAPDIATGHIHDFQFREGAFQPGYLNPQRSMLDDAVEEFFCASGCNELIGTGRETGGHFVVHLDVRRTIARPEFSGTPRFAAGAGWMWQGRPVLAAPHGNEGAISIIGLDDWQTVKIVRMRGAGARVVSHANSPYAWVVPMPGKAAADTLTIVDKQSLKVVARLRPARGRTIGQVGFTRDGRYALASLPGEAGALVVFDAATLKEQKRIPVRDPVGSYNVGNRSSRLE